MLFSGRATDAARFVNWRAGDTGIRESLRASQHGEAGCDVEGPETDRLRAQLAAIRYEFRNSRVGSRQRTICAREMQAPTSRRSGDRRARAMAALVDNATVGVADIFDDFAGVAGGAATTGGLRQHMILG